MRQFEKLLPSAQRSAEIHDYVQAEYRRARVRGVPDKPARGDASKAAAAKYGLSRRQIERIVSKWPAQEAKLKHAAEADWSAWDLRASIARWLTDEELAEFSRHPPAEWALIAIRRANAAVNHLESRLQRHEKTAAEKKSG
jgi:hypothetical protein